MTVPTFPSAPAERLSGLWSIWLPSLVSAQLIQTDSWEPLVVGLNVYEQQVMLAWNDL